MECAINVAFEFLLFLLSFPPAITAFGHRPAVIDRPSRFTTLAVVVMHCLLFIPQTKICSLLGSLPSSPTLKERIIPLPPASSISRFFSTLWLFFLAGCHVRTGAGKLVHRTGPASEQARRPGEEGKCLFPFSLVPLSRTFP